MSTSCRTYEWVMLQIRMCHTHEYYTETARHTWVRHVAHTNESCCKYKCVTHMNTSDIYGYLSHTRLSHVANTNVSRTWIRSSHEWVMSQIRMSHVANTNVSRTWILETHMSTRHAHDWVMSQIRMCHVANTNVSRTWILETHMSTRHAHDWVMSQIRMCHTYEYQRQMRMCHTYTNTRDTYKYLSRTRLSHVAKYECVTHTNTSNHL